MNTYMNVHIYFMYFGYSAGAVFFHYCFFSLQVKFKLPGRTIFIKLLLQNLTDLCYLSDSLAVYHSSNALHLFLLVMGQESRGLFDQIGN